MMQGRRSFTFLRRRNDLTASIRQSNVLYSTIVCTHPVGSTCPSTAGASLPCFSLCCPSVSALKVQRSRVTSKDDPVASDQGVIARRQKLLIYDRTPPALSSSISLPNSFYQPRSHFTVLLLVRFNAKRTPTASFRSSTFLLAHVAFFPRARLLHAIRLSDRLTIAGAPAPTACSASTPSREPG